MVDFEPNYAIHQKYNAFEEEKRATEQLREQKSQFKYLNQSENGNQSLINRSQTLPIIKLRREALPDNRHESTTPANDRRGGEPSPQSAKNNYFDFDSLANKKYLLKDNHRQVQQQQIHRAKSPAGSSLYRSQLQKEWGTGAESKRDRSDRDSVTEINTKSDWTDRDSVKEVNSNREWYDSNTEGEKNLQEELLKLFEQLGFLESVSDQSAKEMAKRNSNAASPSNGWLGSSFASIRKQFGSPQNEEESRLKRQKQQQEQKAMFSFATNGAQKGERPRNASSTAKEDGRTVLLGRSASSSSSFGGERCVKHPFGRTHRLP